jgi:RNase P subunit RPR2
MCMQQPATKNGRQNDAAKPGFGNAFWEPTPQRKAEYLADLARNKLWMDLVLYARDNPDMARVALAHLFKARDDIIIRKDMKRKYCKDADRILRFIAEESTPPSFGKMAVAAIVMMGETIGDEKVFKGELLSGIAMRAKNREVIKYALDQMAALGMKDELRYVAEALVGMSHMGTRKYAAELLAKMEEYDLLASGRGC